MAASKAEPNAPLILGEHVVSPGEERRVELPVAMLPTHTPLSLELHVLNGKRPGPRLWLSAAIHGDELNGVEVIREVLGRLVASTLKEL